ncbi:MAG: sulfite exporter TauE/SafE family protein [Clostridia bacterium]|nr:sulfite exporter TauE/SafE family protein [Clostridia bacterium]
MRFFFLILVGFSSGIFAGMGMGGGTFLVPLLSLCFGVEQIFCQSTNVLCFLILAVVCFVIYAFKKLIDFRVMMLVGLPASVVAGAACIFSLKIHSNVLKIVFAGFIILIGLVMLISNFIPKKENRFLKIRK